MRDQSLAAFLSTFAKLGVLSFGGPAAQIALMHRLLVEERRWLNEQQFTGALSFCMLMPGPEAMQLATYAGWRLKGMVGGLIAGVFFILPGAFVIWALALAYIKYGNLYEVKAAFLGIKAAVIVIVFHALIKLTDRALKDIWMLVIAGLAFVGIFFLNFPYPVILATAALLGACLFSKHGEMVGVEMPKDSKPLQTVLVSLCFWLAPLGVLFYFKQAFLIELVIYFGQLAIFSFGGAYALLGWMTQTIVQEHGWITTTQMVDALGVAETTPGPLILVTQFVSHLAGYTKGGLVFATAAGLLTLWAVFVPCFTMVFVGAPYLEVILAMPRLRAALTGVSAAVIGVIASLSLWFAISVLSPKGLEAGAASLNWAAVGLLGSALILARITNGNLFVTIFGSAILGYIGFLTGLI